MSEEQLEKRMHSLREVGMKHADAKEKLTKLDYSRQILLATLMKEKLVDDPVANKTSAAQEREARADKRYIDHIDALAQATGEEARWAWEKKIVEINFERWKTDMINQTIEKKKYGA